MKTVPANRGEQRVAAAVLEKAQQAVKDFHECFWWWNSDFQPRDEADVREIVLHLRKGGGHRAWQLAQELHQCL